MLRDVVVRRRRAHAPTIHAASRVDLVILTMASHASRVDHENRVA